MPQPTPPASGCTKRPSPPAAGYRPSGSRGRARRGFDEGGGGSPAGRRVSVDDPSTRHHQHRRGEGADVLQGIALDRQQVGGFPRRNDAKVTASQGFGGNRRGRVEDVEG